MTGEEPVGAQIVLKESIREYSAAIARQEEALTRIHAALARVHLADGAFGKMPQADELHKAYNEHAAEVCEIATKLPAQIAKVAAALNMTADIYAALDEAQEKGTGRGPASRHRGHHPVRRAAADAQVAYAWTSTKAETLLKAVVAPKHGKHGLNGLIDEGIEWVIEHAPELPELLDALTGDTEALIAAATVWHEQATALNAVIHELRESAASLPDDWAGDASDSFSEFMGHVVEGLTDLFGVMGQTQQILEEAAREADAAHHMIVGILRTIVEWVAGNLILDAAVLGTATAFEAAGTAAFLAEKATEAHAAASAIAQVYLALHGAVAALETAKATFDSAQGLGALIQFASLGTTFGHTFAIGKISELGSPLVEQALGLEWATGFAARTVIGKLAMAGVGPVGLVRKAGITVAKDVVVPVVKDLAEGKPGEVAKVLRQEAALTGLVAPELPQAQPAETISGLLDGTSSG